MQRPEQAEVLVGRRHDLVLGREAEPGENDVAAVGRRGSERDALGTDADERAQLGARLLAQRQHTLEPLLAETAQLEIAPPLRRHRVSGFAGERPERAGVEIGDAVEHRESGAGLLEAHPTRISTGAWSDSTTPF